MQSQFANILLTYQTFVTNLHLLRVKLRWKLQEKLHRVTGPLHMYLGGENMSRVDLVCWGGTVLLITKLPL